jgi:uncharacterized membrane protein
MSKLSEAKTLGGVGSILMILFFVPLAGGILSIIGAILVLIAIKYISDAVGDPTIFRNMIISIVLAIAGLIVGVLVIAASFFSFMGLSGLTMASIGTVTPATGGLAGLIVGVIAGLAVLWILLIVSAIFTRKSYDSIANGLGVNMFRTAGLLYLIGAATTIILIGFIILFVAIILNIVAFFSIPDTLPQPVSVQMGTTQPPPPPPQV